MTWLEAIFVVLTPLAQIWVIFLHGHSHRVYMFYQKGMQSRHSPYIQRLITVLHDHTDSYPSNPQNTLTLIVMYSSGNQNILLLNMKS